MISRNDPCPCGSGKKFKNCCISKNIDWDARQSGLPMLVPKGKPAPNLDYFPGVFTLIDAKLNAVAKTALKETTPTEERMQTYRTIREANVLPNDAAGFLFDHAAQWLPSGENESSEEEDMDAVLDGHIIAILRQFGADDLANLFLTDRLEYDRRRERGRQFFFGPPDEDLARQLRMEGIID
jgi:hypothetical protein